MSVSEVGRLTDPALRLGGESRVGHAIERRIVVDVGDHPEHALLPLGEVGLVAEDDLGARIVGDVPLVHSCTDRGRCSPVTWVPVPTMTVSLPSFRSSTGSGTDQDSAWVATASSVAASATAPERAASKGRRQPMTPPCRRRLLAHGPHAPPQAAEPSGHAS